MELDTMDAENVVPATEKRAAARPSHTKGSVRPPKIRPQGWDPYRDAPQQVQQRFRRQLDRAHREPQVAIKLLCIECMGYSESEPKGCSDLTCPLFAFNRRIFGAPDRGAHE